MMCQVRVLHLLGSGQPEAAAVARVATDLSRLSDRTRYRYSAWFLGSDGPLLRELSEADVDVTLRPFGGHRDVSGAMSFLTELRRARPDVVHCHTGGRSVRWLVRWGTSARVVVHVHGAGSEGALPAPLRVATDGADAVIANSAATARRVRARDVHVVYPGVTVGEVDASDRCRVGGLVGAAGRLVPVKGMRHLVAAFASVRDRHPNAMLEIAGDGRQRAALEEEASRLGLSRCVRFLGWQSDLVSLFRRWSVFVQPSMEEGFGLAALEAMAAGLPVVATTVGGLNELVLEGVTGRLVSPGVDRELARVLSSMLDDPGLAGRMGAAGRQRAKQMFTADRMVEDILRVYEKVLSPRRCRCLS